MAKRCALSDGSAHHNSQFKGCRLCSGIPNTYFLLSHVLCWYCMSKLFHYHPVKNFHFLNPNDGHGISFTQCNQNNYSLIIFWDGRALLWKGSFLQECRNFRPLLVWGCHQKLSDMRSQKVQYADYQVAGCGKAGQKFLSLDRSNDLHWIINTFWDRLENIQQNPDPFIAHLFLIGASKSLF